MVSSGKWFTALGFLTAAALFVFVSPVDAQSQGSLAISSDPQLARKWDQVVQASLQGEDSLPPVGDLFVAQSRLVEWKPGHLVDSILGMELLLSASPPSNRDKLMAVLRSSGDTSRGLTLSHQDRLSEADAVWRNGNVDVAMLLWRKLLNQVSQSGQDESIRPALIARLAVGELLHGHSRSAQSLARSLSESEAVSIGHLHGSTASWNDLLREELDRWEKPSPEELAIVRRRWSLNLPSHLPVKQWFEWNGQFYTASAAGLEMLAHPTAVLPSTQSVELKLVVQASAFVDMPGRGVSTVARNEETCVLRLGTPLLTTGLSKDAQTEPFVVLLDQARPEEPAWQKSGMDIQPEGEWIISGSPCIAGPEIIVPLRSSGRSSGWGLAGLSIELGTTNWTRSVSPLTDSPERPQAGCDCLNCWPPTEADQYLSTQLGPSLLLANVGGKSVIAITRETHEVRWSRVIASSTDQHSETNWFPLLVEGNAAFTLDDSHQVLSLDCRTGLTNWRSRGVQATGIIGRSDDLLIVTGNGIQGLDLSSGRKRWSFSQDTANPQVNAVILRDRLVVSTSDALWLLDAASGLVLQRWDHAAIGLEGLQHLLISGNSLLCWNSNRCVSLEIDRQSQDGSVQAQ